ncbi:MAG: phosphoserine phosphatase SerB [Halodesulfurarchaeum sp.]
MSLIAFDFDGTLAGSEMTVLLGEQHGVADELASITERAMNGELDYAESLRKRAELLEGLPVEKAQAAYVQVTLRPGTASVLNDLQEAGVPTAILTGGFTPGVEAALERSGTGVDRIVANDLPVTDGTLTGEVVGPLIEGTKDEALSDLADELGIPLDACVAVGDGANDLPMLDVAGLAIGFDPKDSVRPACDVVVEDMAELENVLESEGIL